LIENFQVFAPASRDHADTSVWPISNFFFFEQLLIKNPEISHEIPDSSFSFEGGKFGNKRIRFPTQEQLAGAD
jgi:hypothetical protein